MKKLKIFLIILLIFITNIDVNASTNTYTRTKNKLLIPDDVVVDSNNIGDILNTPAVSSKEKIYDYAEIFSKDQEEYLYERLTNYINNSKIDGIIITTRDLGGYSINQYTYNFYDYNDFADEGVAFIIYLGDNEPKIFMGNSGPRDGKVFSLYNEERIKQILEYVYQDIKIGNYYSATENYIKIIDGFYNLDRNGNYRLNTNGNIVRIVPWFEVSLLAATLTFIIIMLLIFKLNTKSMVSYGLDDNINNSTMMVRLLEDTLIETKYGRKK